MRIVGIHIKLVIFFGVPYTARNSRPTFSTFSLTDTGISFTETKIESLSSVHHLGIRADGFYSCVIFKKNTVHVMMFV